MTDFKIITDSSCDLPAELVEKLDIGVVPLLVNIQGKEYRNELDESELKFADFYEALRGGISISTSASNSGMFYDVMESVLKSGKDVLYIGFSSALSSTYQNAVIASKELKEKYADRKIICLDSKCASLGQGLLVYLCAMKKSSGSDLEETRKYAALTAPKICHWFTVDDLMFLKRGGRISPATAIIGSMLNIKPILHMDDQGKLTFVTKARGRKPALKAIFDKAVQTAEDDLRSQTVFISHGDCEDDVKVLDEMLREYGVRDIVYNYVGPVIGAHSGPGAISVFFVGSER